MRRRGVGKYGVSPAQARTWDGKVWDSKAEMRHAQQLALRLKAGDVDGYEIQQRFPLSGADGKTMVATYVADFVVKKGDQRWVEEVKGMETREWKLKARMFKVQYPRIPLVVYDAGGNLIRTKEIGGAR